MNKNLVINKRGNCDDDIMDFIAGNMLSPDASLNLADPALVSYYKDYDKRWIWIDKDISDTLFIEIRMIMQWNREDDLANIPVEERKPIVMLIHSYGGNLDSCFALLDIMAISKTPIITVNINCAMSAGCLIFLNGHKRYCMPLSQALLHSGSSSGGGTNTFEQVVAQTDNYKRMIDMMQENILTHTKIDVKTLKKWKGKETYLYADDQISWGIADEIITDFSVLYNNKPIKKEVEKKITKRVKKDE